jgi:hypothetical protein
MLGINAGSVSTPPSIAAVTSHASNSTAGITTMASQDTLSLTVSPSVASLSGDHPLTIEGFTPNDTKRLSDGSNGNANNNDNGKDENHVTFLEFPEIINHVPSKTQSDTNLVEKPHSLEGRQLPPLPPHPNNSHSHHQRKTLKVRREENMKYSSLGRGMKVEELQKQYDMLHHSDEPLSMEDAATLVSGSYSLLDDDNGSIDEELLESMIDNESLDDSLSEDNGLDNNSNSGSGTNSNRNSLRILADKKKELQRKLREINQEYQKAKEKREKKVALETSDSYDFDSNVIGFSSSYENWKNNKERKIPHA